MARVLLLYSSVYGLSRAICERIAAELADASSRHVVSVAALTDAAAAPGDADVIVVGASIRHGKHHPTVAAFVDRHLAVLQRQPSAFFSVNLVARKPGKNSPATNPYLRRFLAATPWKPALEGVFAGELDYSRYGPIDKHMMRLVMWINGGPTDPATRTQFTDWAAVRRFAGEVAALADRADRDLQRDHAPAATVRPPVAADVDEAQPLAA